MARSKVVEQLDSMAQSSLRSVIASLVSVPAIAEPLTRVHFDPVVLQIAVESVFALPEFGHSGVWIKALCNIIAQYAVMIEGR